MWIPASHLEELNDRVLSLFRGEIRFLLVSMPPRHGKSEFISKYVPAWALGTHPEWQILLTTYEAEFAASWGAKARDVFAQWAPHLWKLRVHPLQAARDHWRVHNHGGAMRTAGVGGPLTGKGGHIIIIDDPIKNAEEALSKTVKAHQEDWYKSTLRTRLEPGGGIICTMTRWAEDDLAGNRFKAMLEDKFSDKWTELSLPAIARANDPIKRRPGEALFPERYPVEQLMQIKSTVGSFWWSALYDQEPKPLEGNIFKRHWWQYCIPNGTEFEVIIQSWDLSFKKTQGASAVGCHVYGKRGPQKHLLDRLVKQMTFTETLKAILDMKAKWPKTAAIIIEDKANGPAVMDVLGKHLTGIIPFSPETAKEVRAAAVSPEVEAGNVWLPQATVWVPEFVDNMAAAPNGPMEDSDCLSQALLWFASKYTKIEHQAAGARVMASIRPGFFG